MRPMSTIEIQSSGRELVGIVASNIRAEAARRGLYQIDLAAALGVTSSAISKRWKGVRSWKLEELPTIAKALGVKVTDLMTPTNREELAPPTGLEPATSGLVSSTWWTVAA